MLHYTMCGLDNVWLKNGYVVRDTPYGKAVAVRHAEQLHQMLAMKLVKKPGKLTGKELRFLRVQLGLTQEGLAKLLGVTEQSVSLWERRGKVPRSGDAMTRFYFMARHEGDVTISQAIDRVKTVEKMVHQKIVAASTGRKWSSKVESVEDCEVAA